MSSQNTTSDSNQSDKIGGWLLFIALNLIALPFSAYQTYQGYEPDLGPIMGGAVAALTTVFFMTINYSIAQWRKSGKKIGILLILYVLPLSFSYPGNFGAFYSQMTGTLKTNMWGTKRYVAQQNLANAARSIEQNNATWMATKLGYEKERQSAVDQYNGVPPGIGKEFKKHYQAMAGHLGMSSFTRTRSRKLDDWLDIADKQFEKRRSEVLDELTCFESSRRSLQDVYDEGDNAQVVQAWTQVMRGNHLNDLATANNALVDCIESHIGASAASNSLSTISMLGNTAGFAWAFHSAYVAGEDWTNAIISTVLALIIDLGVLLFIIILFKPQRARGRLTGRKRIVNDLK